MEKAKFNYNNAELFISKVNIYGSRYFLLVDIVNNTIFSGWTASSIASPYKAEYIVFENTSQKEVRRIKEHKLRLGYKELTSKEFQDALGIKTYW